MTKEVIQAFNRVKTIQYKNIEQYTENYIRQLYVEDNITDEEMINFSLRYARKLLKASPYETKEILNIASKYKDDYPLVAIRTQPVPFEVGEIISYQSDLRFDGNPIRQKADGVFASIIYIYGDLVGEQAFKMQLAYGIDDENTHTAILGAYVGHYGYDKTEVVLLNAEPLEIIQKNKGVIK